MKQALHLLTIAIVFVSSQAQAAEYFIAPGGSNASAGTIANPWGTFDFAIDQLSAGDTLFVRGGTYNLSNRLTLSSGDGGAANNRVNIWAYESGGIMESPILDFAGMSNSLWGQSNGRGIQINNGVDWVHIKGLTIQNARDNGLQSQSDNSIFERMTTRWNGDSGLQIDGSSSFNLVLNSDSYENYDPSANGENADGFAIKFEDLGPGNVVRGSRAWANADDGWDMWESTIGGVLVEDSWAFDNGVLLPRFITVDALEAGDVNADNFNGDATGFKLGQDGGRHVLNRVLAWNNRNGIDVNGNGNGVTVQNSTSFDNVRNWQFDETDEDTLNPHVLTNNISFSGSSSDNFDTGVTSSHNTWNGIPVNEADFLSLDDTIARGPRNADGSLPISNFLRLVPTSNLIDAGIDVGLPFNGPAPDLGAFETSPIFLYDSADFDEDGDVDADDLADWQAGYGLLTGAAHADGDADQDGDVDGADFLAWQRGYAPDLEGLASNILVPEPSTVTLISILLATTLTAGRCRH
jgi:hypothetical protein